MRRYTHMDTDALARRYPNLIRAMCWTACLSTGEAACALRDWRQHRAGLLDESQTMGGEAVAHFGGTRRVLTQAVKHRRWVRTVTTLNA